MLNAICDFRHAIRSLRRTPVLFAAALLTLALGTGLATGVLAVAYGVLLRPLPYADPERLVGITIHILGDETRSVGLGLEEFEEWRSRFRAFEHVAGYASGEFTVRAAGPARTVRAAMVTDGFFETLSMNAVEGSANDLRSGSMAAVFSRRLRDQLGPDTSWRERGVTIGTGDFHVGAIMPAEFGFPTDRVDLWVYAKDTPRIGLFESSDQRRFQLVGRLAPGVALAQAAEDVHRVARDIESAKSPGRQRDGTVRPLHERSRQEARATVVPFAAGAALVLLIACANVSGLLVGRAASREREFAVRRALGGSYGQILRASLAESVIVSVCGWAAGLWLANLMVQTVRAAPDGTLSNLQAVRLDMPVILLSLAMAGMVAVLSGAGPALRAAMTSPSSLLKSATREVTRRGTAFRGGLVAAQIALTVVLLVSAGLLMRTVGEILAAERGFDTTSTLAMRLRLTQDLQFEARDRAPLLNQLLADVRALSGVTAAGIGSDVPPNGTQLEMTIRVVDERGDRTHRLSPVAATPGYLEALGVTLISGRLFEERDRMASPPRVVVSETAARMMYGERDPVSREWPLPGTREGVKPLVIGVVRDIRQRGLDEAAPGVVYVPWEFLAPTNSHLVIRTSGSTDAVAGALPHIVQRLDPSLPLFMPQTMQEIVAESIADRRLALQLASGFAVLALALAGVALWGAMAQNVLERRRELAVRLALGSTQGEAVRLVLRGGIVLTVVGLAAGLLAGRASARLLEHLLHGVAPSDPLTFVAASALAAATAVLACYLPARRAAAVSPAELLRDV